MHKIHCPSALILISLSLAGTSCCSHDVRDKKVTEDIRAKIADSHTKEAQGQVTTKSGKVILVGKVTAPAAQRRVEQIAQQESGTSGVNDETIVDPKSAPEAPSVSVASDTTPPLSLNTPPRAPAEAAPTQPRTIVVPSGTSLVIRTSTGLSSEKSQPGQRFIGTLAEPVRIRGTTVFPAGSVVRGTVVDARSKGKIKGEAILDLSLNSITARGRTYSVRTVVLQNTMKGKGKRTAVATGGGAAGGGLIGGIAGGAKGAGIGALVGAGAGVVGSAMTGNKQIEIPAESALKFRLAAPVTTRPTS